MKRIFCSGVLTVLIFACFPRERRTEEGFQTKDLLQKDISAYAGGDLLLSIGEVTVAPGASLGKHRHPGPTFVYVLEGSVESEVEGMPSKVYHAGESFYENAKQLHILTKNPSNKPARILAYHLSRKGEPLTTMEQ
jgi:quercetin dioxygenase-like cupin family protein